MANEQDTAGKLAELIKDIKIAMLTTVADDGSLRSRPMATQNI
jgi:general stress protein 26